MAGTSRLHLGNAHGEPQELLPQAVLITNIWHALDAPKLEVAESDWHHFNVIEGLAGLDSVLVRTMQEQAERP